MSTPTRSISSHGTGGSVVDIECSLSNNLPAIVIVGFANRAVSEARERIRGAFANSRIMLPRRRITVNLAPADLPKADSGFDMAIAVSILLASRQLLPLAGGNQAFIGELGLEGQTRAVRGIIGKLLTGRAAGITAFYIPAANLKQARLVPHITLTPVDSLKQLVGHLAGRNYERIITVRPFRAPHHSASHSAITGGGAGIKPGEISLAHRGVLFFDELPEFSRDTLEALRQPLEDRIISVARAGGRAEYPASFMLVATANPCPCGYYGTAAGVCRCQSAQVLRYRQRLSGPILDRIDICADVHEVLYDKLLAASGNSAEDQAAKDTVAAARRLQERRFAGSAKLNADMTTAGIKRLGRLDEPARALLDKAAARLHLSARAYLRTVRVARTIADLDNSAGIGPSHIGEALTYRQVAPIATETV